MDAQYRAKSSKQVVHRVPVSQGRKDMLFFRAIWIRRFTWESVLEQEYWESKWQAGEIAFHQEQVNPDLIRFAESLLSQADSQVLVPLCGKSQDMLWLAKKGHSVLGVEIVEQAAHEFFSENKISATQKDLADFRIYSDEAIQIWVGDFFKLTQSHLKDVKAVYDRAALVALPPDLRKQYAAHLKEVLPKNTKYLLLNFEYDLETSKPPFLCE